jgi:hypothetical protein
MDVFFLFLYYLFKNKEYIMNNRILLNEIAKEFKSEFKKINENRFKGKTSMFGYSPMGKKIFKSSLYPALVKVVKEFTEAYPTQKERSRYVWDLVDELYKVAEKKDKNIAHTWPEETIGTYLDDAFKHGLNEKNPTDETIKDMISQMRED